MNITKGKAILELQKAATASGLSVQYKKDKDGKLPVRVLNSSKKVVAEGSLLVRGKFVDAKDLASTAREIKQLNCSTPVKRAAKKSSKLNSAKHEFPSMYWEAVDLLERARDCEIDLQKFCADNGCEYTEDIYDMAEILDTNYELYQELEAEVNGCEMEAEDFLLDSDGLDDDFLDDSVMEY